MPRQPLLELGHRDQTSAKINARTMVTSGTDDSQLDVVDERLPEDVVSSTASVVQADELEGAGRKPPRQRSVNGLHGIGQMTKIRKMARGRPRKRQP